MVSTSIARQRFGCSPSPARVERRMLMTHINDFQAQANVLMVELDDSTSAMMGLVCSRQTTGPAWDAAARRQRNSYGRWSAFLKKSDHFGPVPT